MTTISNSVPLDRVSAVAGYSIEGSLEGVALGFLPQAIDIIAEASTGTKQPSAAEIFEFTTAKQVATKYGDNSPAYLAARILRPLSGDKLGSIKTRILAVPEDVSATAGTSVITVTGTPDANTTHVLRINGRTSIDGQVYAYSVTTDDTVTTIAAKIADVMNKVFGCPLTGSSTVGVATGTTGWKGATAVSTVEVEVGDEDAGLSYAIVNTPGTGQDANGLGDALALIGDQWTTLIVNCLDSSSANLDSYQAWVGTPNDKDGRYTPTLFKPALVLFGDNERSVYNDESGNTGCLQLTDTRRNEVGCVFCPAPNSQNFDFETAADVAYELGYIAHTMPSKDTQKTLLSNISLPTDENIGDFSDVSVRDSIVKVGSSTVKKNGTNYEIVELVTTYHPDDEPATSVLFRYVRDLICDWNIQYSYKLLEKIYVEGKTIVSDSDNSGAENTISPKRWKSILVTRLAPSLIANGIITDLAFFTKNVSVKISSVNPNRLETNFKVKRTGVARVLSTTVVTQFNFN